MGWRADRAVIATNRLQGIQASQVSFRDKGQ
jgi:hypothetical protein